MTPGPPSSPNRACFRAQIYHRPTKPRLPVMFEPACIFEDYSDTKLSDNLLIAKYQTLPHQTLVLCTTTNVYKYQQPTIAIVHLELCKLV